MSAPRKREPSKAAQTAAAAYETNLAERATKVRGDVAVLTPDIFLELHKIACEPIPPGYILYVSAGDGKPYASTGVRSVQVQIARMDAVFTPLWWDYETTYIDDGKLCEVVVSVHVDGAVVKRSAWGGVDRANNLGNLRKGSFTNAAKVAFARLGVGGEIYLGGAADHDPDADPAAAKAQAAKAPQEASAEPPLTDDARERVLGAFMEAGITDDFPLYLKAVGIKSPEEITAAHAYKLRELLDAEIAKRAAKDGGES